MGTQQITVLNNPVRNELRFDYQVAAKGMITVHLYNGTGLLLYSQKQYCNAGTNQFNVPAQKITAKGSYIIRVTTEQMQQSIAKAIKL